MILTKVVHRTLLSLAVLFSVVVVTLALVVNVDSIKRVILNHVNEAILHPLMLEADVESLGFSWTSAPIRVRGLQIRTLRPCDNRPCPPLAKVANLTVGISPLAWFRGDFIPISYLGLSDGEIALVTDAQNRLPIGPIDSKIPPSEQAPVNVVSLLATLRKTMPAVVDITNVRLIYEDSQVQDRPDASLNLRFAKYRRSRSSVGSEISVLIGDSWYCSSDAEGHSACLELTSLESQLVLTPEGQIRLSNLRLGTGGNRTLQAIGTLWPNENISETQAEINVTGDIDLPSILLPLGIKGRGGLSLDTAVSYRKQKASAAGRLSWSNGFIGGLDDSWGYDLYSGTMNATYTSTRADIQVQELAIVTPQQARLTGSASVRFPANLVVVDAELSAFDLGFRELMSGLGIPTDAVDFWINSDNIALMVRVPTDDQLNLLVKVDAGVDVRNFQVPSMHSPTRTPLDDAGGDLHLRVTDSDVFLTDTSLWFAADPSKKITVEKGVISTNTGKVEIRLNGKGLDLANAEYFLLDDPDFFARHPTEGSANLTALIAKAGDEQPVEFSANMQATNTRLYGVQYAQLSGQWGIGSLGVWGKNLQGRLGAAGNTSIHLDDFAVNFDDEVTSHFNGEIQGSVKGLFDSLQGLFKGEAAETFTKSLTGKIEKSRINLHGPIAEPLQWSLQANARLADLEFNQGHIAHLNLQIDCTAGNCHNSQVTARGWRTVKGDPRTAGVASAKLEALSSDQINGRLRLEGIPVEGLPFLQDLVQGRLTGTVRMSGPWTDWDGALSLVLHDTILAKKRLGFIRLEATTDRDGLIQITADAQNNQILGRFRVPRMLDGPASGYVWLRGLDFSPLLPDDFRSQFNIFSRVDGEILLEGPAPLTKIKPKTSWFHHWLARLRLDNAEISLRERDAPEDLILRILTPDNDDAGPLPPTLTAHWNQVRLQRTSISIQDRPGTDLGVLSLMGQLNPQEKTLAAQGDLGFDLASFPAVFPRLFGKSQGRLTASVDVSGTFDKVRVNGQGKLENGEILILPYPPKIENLNVAFELTDRKLQIRSLTGRKGDGSFSIAGLTTWEETPRSLADMGINLRVDLKRVFTRVGIPVLDFVDVSVDGGLTICSKNYCGLSDRHSQGLRVDGQLSVLDARISRDLTCQAIIERGARLTRGTPDTRNGATQTEPISLDLHITAPGTISLDTVCARSQLTVEQLRVTGNNRSPRLLGAIETVPGTGEMQLGNIRFFVTSSRFSFDGTSASPAFEMQLVSKVTGRRADRSPVDYDVYLTLSGRADEPDSIVQRLWADPPFHPDGQKPLSQGDLVIMVLTGEGPGVSSSGLSTNLIANQLATLGTSSIFEQAHVDSSVTRMLRRLGAGLIEQVAIDPIFEDGQPKFRLRAVLSPMDNVNVNVSTVQDPTRTEETRNAEVDARWLLNDRINLGLEVHTKDQTGNTPLPVESQIGIMFRFGGE